MFVGRLHAASQYSSYYYCYGMLLLTLLLYLMSIYVHHVLEDMNTTTDYVRHLGSTTRIRVRLHIR